MRLSREVATFIRAARVAHLATADSGGEPLVIPICFAFEGEKFFSPIDEKPKRSTNLKRVRNISENPKICLLIDRYEEDWQRLGYVLIRGTATMLVPGNRHRKAVQLLRRKYPQYRTMAIEERPMIAIRPESYRTWGYLG